MYEYMKKAIYTSICAILTGLILTSCHKDPPLVADALPDKYGILTDTPSDPIKHHIYEFYKDYSTVLIKNPTIADYKFNFKDDNGISIIAPKQTPEVLNAGLEFLNKAIISLYPKDFLKNNLPFSIILADTIKMASYGETHVLKSYASTGFLALGGINSSLSNMSNEEFIKARASLNSDFWAKYMSATRGIFKVPEAFSKASEEVEKDIFHPNGFYLGYENPKDIDFYKYGLISYNTVSSYISEEEDFYSVYAPTKAQDLEQWMIFVFSTKPSDLETIFQSYPVMKKKYDILRKAMLTAGFDLSKLKL